MLVFGTEMHIVTFVFVCLETVILFYLVTYKLARPEDSTTILNIILISIKAKTVKVSAARMLSSRI